MGTQVCDDSKDFACQSCVLNVEVFSPSFSVQRKKEKEKRTTGRGTNKTETGNQKRELRNGRTDGHEDGKAEKDATGTGKEKQRNIGKKEGNSAWKEPKAKDGQRRMNIRQELEEGTRVQQKVN